MGRKLLLFATLTIAAALAAVFSAGAFTVTRAMHPPRHTVATVCPCISHVNCRDAAVAGDQHGWYFVPDHQNGGAILMLHGIGATREDMVALGAVFERAGYSVLAPDLRGFGESGGPVTFGVEEAHDVHKWVDWLAAQRGVERVYGFGVSLGGSVLLESLEYEKRFRALVVEAAFSDFPSIASERMSHAMPPWLSWLATPYVDSGLLWARLRYGLNLRESSAVRSVARAHVPVLAIHGLADEETVPQNSRRIAEANPSMTQLWLIPKAAHANAWATAGKEFEARVLAWYGAH